MYFNNIDYLVMGGYFQRHSFETVSAGDYYVDIVENPWRALTEAQRNDIATNAEDILKVTTGVVGRASDSIQKSLFGKRDGGRVLFLFRTAGSLAGFMSHHLLNDGGQPLRCNDSTVLHVGSSHIRPAAQGNHLMLLGLREYFQRLPDELRPRYVEGFTQSPRLLKLATFICRRSIYPSLSESSTTQELRDLQNELLPRVVSGIGSRSIVNGCVVRGSEEQVYDQRLHTNDRYDRFFYDQLGVNPQNGDFLHFVGILPDWILGNDARD